MFERMINPLTCCIVLSSFWIGCSVEVSLVQSEGDLSSFHIANAGNAQAEAAPFEDGVADFYMDYSGSVSEGIAKSYELMDHLTAIFDHSKSKGFVVHDQVAAHPLTLMFSGQGDPFFARNMDNYSKDLSRIDLAIKQIVKEGRTAVFLTDFRQEDGQQSRERCEGDEFRLLDYHCGSWATLDFQKWLQAGHGVEVYASSKWMPNHASQSPRLFLLVFVQNGDTAASSVPQRIRQAFDKDNGNQWPGQAPVALQLQKGGLEVAEGKTDVRVPGLKVGLTCLLDWHRPDLGYSYYRFDRASLISALESDSALLAVMKPDAMLQDVGRVQLSAYSIGEALTQFLANTDTSQTVAKDSPAMPKRNAKRPDDWVKSDLFTLPHDKTGRNDSLKIRVSDPLRIPMASSFYCIDLLEPKFHLSISKSASERMTWSYVGCQMKSLSSSLEAALQNSPSSERVLYSIYVEILN